MNAVEQPVVENVDGETVVRPRTDLDGASLLVERKELDVDRTQAEVDRRRLPDDETVRMNRHLRDQLHGEVAVGAARTQHSHHVHRMLVCKSPMCTRPSQPRPKRDREVGNFVQDETETETL